MENQLYKRLILAYYAMFALFFAVFVCALGVVKNFAVEFSPNVRIALQYCGIMYMLASVPFALWYYNREVKKLAATSASIEERATRYARVSLWRIVLVSLGVMINVALYCFLHDVSSFYCAMMAAIAYVFCKPQRAHIAQLLSNDESEQE